MRLFGNNDDCKAPARWVGVVLFLVIALVVWQLAAWIANAPYIVPTPWAVVVRASELVVTADFWIAVAASLGRILLGFAIGMLLGVGLALAMAAAPMARAVFAPFVKLIRTTPIVCFILLALLWVDSAHLSTCMSALMVLPVAWTNTIEGLDAIPQATVEVMRVFDVRPLARLFKVYVPAISDQLASAASVGMGLAWKSGITAEVLTLPIWGIGTGIYRAKLGLEAADIFVWTIAIVLISLALEFALRKLAARMAGRGGAR